MASTSSTVTLPWFRSSSFHSHLHPPRFVNFSSHFQRNDLRRHRIFCGDPSPTKEKPKSGIDAAATETSSSGGARLSAYPTKDLNWRVAVASVVAAVGLFLSRRLDFGGTSLKDLSAVALPYEEGSPGETSDLLPHSRTPFDLGSPSQTLVVTKSTESIEALNPSR